jgi:hypothetical protein
MKIFVPKIITNDDDPDFKWIEVLVRFWDDIISPHFSADVTVFLEKQDRLTIEDIQTRAIQRPDRLYCGPQRSRLTNIIADGFDDELAKRS